MKQRGIPKKVIVKEALLRRIPCNHRKKPIIEAELAQDRACFKGKKYTDFNLRALSRNDFQIYNDLYLNDGNPFQIDSLIASPTFILLIDSKNIDGHSTIESQFNQFVQENNGKSRRVKNPIAQIKRQSFLFMEWLQKRGFYSVPIESLVANCNPVGILMTDDPLLAEKVLNAEILPTRIENLQKKYTKQIFVPTDLKKFNKLLLEANTQPLFDIFKMYGIMPHEIIKGIPCPECGILGMERKNRYWQCPKCGEKSTSAHVKAIHDYFLLIKPTITVSECCDFLGITSRHIAKRLLLSMGLSFKGDNKGRIYFSNFE